MNLLLDLVGSVIIAGIMLLMMLNASNLSVKFQRFASDSETPNATECQNLIRYFELRF